ncbi:Serine carboxypeptidase 3, variant 3 [Basidiobolus ranarum]|uniref:Serine carboxypeptidase 3, variant 3 n=1 Tax=Basidiobolus ranarum TaxID=34480 RepID=A0ABR2VYQ5_9FUNG
MLFNLERYFTRLAHYKAVTKNFTLKVTTPVISLYLAELTNRKSLFSKSDCNLPDNFQTWFSITQLHVWMLMVRLRAEPNGKEIVQQMVNFYFLDAEQRIKDAGVTSSKIVTSTVKDLVAGFHGGVMAYDEGMCKDDPVLAAALWRNLFTTVLSHKHGKEMAYMTRYVREQLSHLDRISSEELQSGNLEFGKPKASL